MAYDVRALYALDDFGRVGPGADVRGAGRGLIPAAGGLDHGAGPAARLRSAQKNGSQVLGRSRGGLTSKLYAVAGARGRFVRGYLRAGPRPVRFI